MRYSTLSNLAVLASSLLVKGAFASPLGQRAQVTDVVMVTEEIVVTANQDGSYATGKAIPVGTTTIEGSVVVTTIKQSKIREPTTSTTPTPTPTPETSSAAPKSAEAAVFKEASSSSSSVIPVAAINVVPSSSSVFVAPVAPKTSIAPEPTTTSTPVPTTFATTTSAARVASTSASTSSGSSSGKRGVAYNDASLVSAFSGDTKYTWAYNWGGSTATIPDSFEFVPMLWGTGSHADNWDTYATKALASGSKHLLAFNEPDHSEQANISPADAAAGYVQYMEPYASKARLGSPAVTNGGAPMGLDWLEKFIAACSDCTIHFNAIHWYNGGDAEAFKTYVQKAYTTGGNRPLWITEFQAPGSGAEQTAWLAEVIPWLDSSDMVERYSYFMASEGNLISGGVLSTLAKAIDSVL